MTRRGRPPHPDILTPREWEVLALIRDGLTNEQIAERIGVTIHAARYHVSQILSKLGVATREAAAAWQPEPERTGSRWMRALQIALVLSAAAVIVAVGVLAWGVLRGSDDDAQATSEAHSASSPTVGVELKVRDMQIVSPDIGWALTDQALLAIRLGDQQAPVVITPSILQAGDIRAVAFPNPSVGYLLAGQRVESSSFSTAYRKFVLKTTNGGRTWREALDLGRSPLLDDPSSSTAFLYFFDEEAGWLLAGNDSAKQPQILAYRTTDGGETWTNIDATQARVPLYSISQDVGWSGNREMTRDGGESWTRGRVDPVYRGGCPAGVACPYTIYGVPHLTPDGSLLDVIVVGNTESVPGEKIRVDQSTDEGETWTTIANEDVTDVNGIGGTQILPDGSVIAFAASGSDAVRLPPDSQTFERFSVQGLSFARQMQFATPLIGWAISVSCTSGLICYPAYGSLAQTEDGGHTWTPVTTPDIASPAPTP